MIQVMKLAKYIHAFWCCFSEMQMMPFKIGMATTMMAIHFEWNDPVEFGAVVEEVEEDMYVEVVAMGVGVEEDMGVIIMEEIEVAEVEAEGLQVAKEADDQITEFLFQVVG